MNKNNPIQDELNELNSGLNPSSNYTPYSVPEGYFEGLANSVLAKIKGEAVASASEEIELLSPVLSGISRDNTYFVPDNYFQSNLEGLKAFTSESGESLVLSFIDKEMPYEVPAGYFANVPEQVLAKISHRSKVVPVMKRKWMRLAVAAMIAGIITISGITYFNNGSRNSTTSDPVAAELKKASTKELNEFIKTTAAVDLTNDPAQLMSKNNSAKTEAKKLFAGVSDKELDAFLKQMPTDDETCFN